MSSNPTRLKNLKKRIELLQEEECERFKEIAELKAIYEKEFMEFVSEKEKELEDAGKPVKVYKSVDRIDFDKDGDIAKCFSEGGCYYFGPNGRVLEKEVADVINMLVEKLWKKKILEYHSDKALRELALVVQQECLNRWANATKKENL